MCFFSRVFLFLPSQSFDVVLHSLGAVPTHLFGDVAVGIKSKGCRVVTEVLLYRLNIVTVLKRSYRKAMAKIVKTHFGNSNLANDLLKMYIVVL